MELLVLKAKNENRVVYLKKEAQGFIFCEMNKASVYPLTKMAEVKSYQKEALESGLKDVEIFKLVITEEKIDE
ncbi:MAG: hypothetical protein GY951_15910 [Psychromonas sp.]|nr:hypothetical protein [Psychromonas sp.]